MLNRILLILKRQALIRLNHQSTTFHFLRAIYLGYIYFKAESKKPAQSQRISLPKMHLSRSGYSGEITLAKHTEYSESGFSNPSPLTLDIFVPVFNRFDLVRDLLVNLANQKSKIQETFVEISINVGDDFSNPRTSKNLELLCSELKINYKSRKQNLGVVKNVNAAFSNSSSDYFLLLNSDIAVGDDFILRMLKPMLSDESLGAITALTLGEIQKHVKLESGDNWRLIDSFLGEQLPQVVDACTAISYAILIKRKAVSWTDLMDVTFGIGYGEDSDLHYRIVENGFRSVWNLNLLVSHLGGSSFTITEEHDAHKAHGNRLFHSRWGLRYRAEIEQHEAELKLALERVLSGYTTPNHDWIWVISPAINPRIGGLLIAAAGVRGLIEHTPFVSLVDISDNENHLVYDSFVTTNSKAFRKKCRSGDKVILVGLGGIRWWEAHKGIIPKMKTYYFLQGPDSLIDPTGIEDFREVQNAFDGLITNSACQSELGKDLFPLLTPTQIEIGTDDAYFSLPEVSLNPSRDIDVLFCLRNEWGKGANIGLALINYLSVDMKVAIFGSGERNGITGEVLDLGEVSHSELLSILRRTKVYVDTSIFEGFGLIPREAADCGARAFILPNSGGLDPLLEYPNHFTALQKFWNIPASARKIIKETSSPVCEGCGYCEREPIASLGSQLVSVLK